MDTNNNNKNENDSDAAAVTTSSTTTNSSTRSRSIFGRNNKLYGMFEDSSHQKTDAGSLFWCGILHWQRNKDLLDRWTATQRQTTTATATATQEATATQNDNDKNKNKDASTSSSSSSSYYTDVAKKHPLIHAFFVVVLLLGVLWSIDPDNRFTYLIHCVMGVLIVAFLSKLFQFQQKRKQFRKKLAIAHYHHIHRNRKNNNNNNDSVNSGGASSSNDDNDDEDLKVFLKEHRQEINEYGVHNIIGGANSNNGLFCNKYDDEDESENHQPPPHHNNNNDSRYVGRYHCCAETWTFFSDLLCGVFCGCNIQICGMCAIAQESRYLKDTLLPSSSERPDLWQRDFLTMQPWSEYYPSILRLRLSYETNPLSHLKAMSTLSRRILITVSTLFIMISLLVLVPIPIHFPRWQVLIVSIYFYLSFYYFFFS